MSLDLVTGASGFIGRHLVRRLISQGCRVRVLCRSGSVARLGPETRGVAEIVEGDLRDDEAVRRATRGVRRVFHCAGHVSDWGSEEQYAVNVVGTQRMLDAACEQGVGRFVHMSSIAVFGVPAPPSFDDVCPEFRDLRCLSAPICAHDRTRGCAVCRCEEWRQLGPPGYPQPGPGTPDRPASEPPAPWTPKGTP